MQEKRSGAGARPMTKRQLSRHEREMRLRRIIYLTTAAVAGLILVILGFGYYREVIGKGDEPVATVGSVGIPARDLAKVMGYYNVLYYSQAMDLQQIIATDQEAAKTDADKQKLVDAANGKLQQLSYQAQSLDSVALDALVEGEVLRREAASRGYTPNQAARDLALGRDFDLGVGQAAQPTQANVDAAKSKQKQLLDGGRIMADDDFNRLILDPGAYRANIQDSLSAQVPTHGEQIKTQHILVETEQAAKDALAMLQKGELDFAATVKQLSQDTSNKDSGGDLGWFPKGVMDPAFEMAAFALEPGQTSEPVQSSFGWHIIKVNDKASDRPVEPQLLEQLRASAYQKWYSEQKLAENNAVTYLVDDSKMKWVQANMPKPAPAPAPSPQAPAVPATQPPASPTPGAAPAVSPAPATPQTSPTPVSATPKP